MILFLSGFFYVVSFFLSLMFYYFKIGGRLVQIALFLAVTLYFLATVVKAVEAKSFPFADVYGFYSLLGNFTILALLSLSIVKVQISKFYAFISLAGFLSTLLALPSQPSPYRDILFVLHIICAVVSYSGVFFGSLSSLLKLVLERRLKSKKLYGFSLPISTLAFSEKLFINVAFVMLTFTLIFGSLWTRNFLGKHWVNDPKLISTFSIWIYYAIVVHLNLLRTLKPKRISQLNIIGSIFTLVNLFLIRHEI